jgi:hypothetical protein
MQSERLYVESWLEHLMKERELESNFIFWDVTPRNVQLCFRVTYSFQLQG